MVFSPASKTILQTASSARAALAPSMQASMTAVAAATVIVLQRDIDPPL
jgi:hypothetical protein